MEHNDILRDIVVLFALAVVVLYAAQRLRLPTIIGFILTGIVAGPQALGFISATSEVQSIADIGIVLLLFTIGIEFSFRNLLSIKRSVLLGGSLQVPLTFLASFAAARYFGLAINTAIFAGFLVSLSSTAIVLKVLQDRAEVDSPHGNTSLGILIFQDIIVIPMMLLVPLLAGDTGNGDISVADFIIRSVLIIVSVIVAANWVVPQLLYQVTKLRSREAFLISIITIGLAAAWLTSLAGLSLALGAFLAGLIISESEYGHQALSNVIPFRDIFASFFFISIGMLLDIEFLLQNPQIVLLLTLGVILLKGASATAAASLTGFPLRTAVLAGLALSQIGEFSFILARVGAEHELLSGRAFQIFLDVTILTMMATPLIINAGPLISQGLLRLPLPQSLAQGWIPLPKVKEVPAKDHLIIVGFGINGRNVAQTAAAANIPYIILETNPDTVRAEQARGEPILFGDATQEHVLEHANIADARVMAIAISDAAATRRIVDIAKRLNPSLYTIVRTRYLQEIEPLRQLGANEVIPEEFETSIEIFARVLAVYLIPEREIERFVDEVRSDSYEMLRSVSGARPTLENLGEYFADIELTSLRVGDNSTVAGKTLSELEMRRAHGVSVIAIRRDSEVLTNPDADSMLLPGDLVAVVGAKEDLIEVEPLFNGG